jgi:hypothetical protein
MTSDDKRKEQEGIEHAIHGFPPVRIVGGQVRPPKGVTIMDKHGVVNQEDNRDKGVEILDPRHGASK